MASSPASSTLLHNGLRLCSGVSDCLSRLASWPIDTDRVRSHLKFTIPPALFLTLLLRPLLNRTDVYKIAFLITVSRVLDLLSQPALIYQRYL